MRNSRATAGDTAPPQERFNVIGCDINRTNAGNALEMVLRQVRDGGGGYVCFANVHCAVMARRNPEYRKILNESFMSLPDGKPLYWVARWRGLAEVGHTPGPDFLPFLLAIRRDPPLRHFFYGARSEVLSTLVDNVRNRFPTMEIAGAISPPFRDSTEEEVLRELDKIRQARPDVVWVGLGAPKQEQWMARHWRALKPAVLLGVGAAFDFHAGAIKRAPRVLTHLGLEWAFRLACEPGRLWKRYLTANSLFLWYLMKDRLWKKKK